MDRIERNDPYESPGASNAGPLFQDDSLGIPPLQGAQVIPDAFYYIRLGGTLVGALVILAGLYFAALSFDIVSDVLRSPQQLNAYLDEWYIPLKEDKVALEQPHPVEPAEAPEPIDASASPPNSGLTPGTQPIVTNATAGPSASEPASAEDGDGASDERQREIERLHVDSQFPPQQQTELERLRDFAAQRTSKAPAAKPKNDSPVAQSIELLTDALTRGGLPRLAGALVILLLVSMLIRIPFGLIKAGTDIVKATLPEKSRSNR